MRRLNSRRCVNVPPSWGSSRSRSPWHGMGGYAWRCWIMPASPAISRHSQHGTLSGVLRPGSVIVSPPDDGAFVRWDRCRMVAIGIGPAGLHNRLSLGDSSRFVSSAATRIHRDPLLTAIMTTLWHESQLHGLSGDFFDHCIRRIFTRLGELVNVQPTRRRDRPLTDRQIKMVKEFVETHLVDGPERLAAMVDLSPDHFSRAFRASLGTSPLRYVSDRRVRRAKAMLLEPQRTHHGYRHGAGLCHAEPFHRELSQGDRNNAIPMAAESAVAGWWKITPETMCDTGILNWNDRHQSKNAWTANAQQRAFIAVAGTRSDTGASTRMHPPANRRRCRRRDQDSRRE